jgi:hypothetical protein
VTVDVTGFVDRMPDGGDGRITTSPAATVLDTRTGKPFAAGETRGVQVTGAPGVPTSGVSAAVLNIVAVTPSADGALTAWRAADTKPALPTVVFGAGRTAANRAVVALGGDGRIKVSNATGTTHVVVEVVGWLTDSTGGGAGGVVTPIAPVRVTAAHVQGGQPLKVSIAGAHGLPAKATAALLVVTVAKANGPGTLTAGPAGTAQPATIDVAYPATAPISNLVVVKVGTGGAVSMVTSAGTADVFVDVAGYVV